MAKFTDLDDGKGCRIEIKLGTVCVRRRNVQYEIRSNQA